MAIPEKNIIAPAIRLLYFSTGLRFILLSPSLNASTIDIIVEIVTTENRIDTTTAPAILFSAAGYITIGIKGFTGAKHEDQEQNPWGSIDLSLFHEDGSVQDDGRVHE